MRVDERWDVMVNADGLPHPVTVDEDGRCTPGSVPKAAVRLAIFMARAFSPELWGHSEGVRVARCVRDGQEVAINKMLRVLQTVPELHCIIKDDELTLIPIRFPKIW